MEVRFPRGYYAGDKSSEKHWGAISRGILSGEIFREQSSRGQMFGGVQLSGHLEEQEQQKCIY